MTCTICIIMITSLQRTSSWSNSSPPVMGPSTSDSWRRPNFSLRMAASPLWQALLQLQLKIYLNARSRATGPSWSFISGRITFFSMSPPARNCIFLRSVFSKSKKWYVMITCPTNSIGLRRSRADSSTLPSLFQASKSRLRKLPVQVQVSKYQGLKEREWFSSKSSCSQRLVTLEPSRRGLYTKWTWLSD
jgi:hypothetical protein